MDDCIFCRIVAGDQGSDVVYQDDQVTAFRDINPVAPTHILVIPNTHLESVNDLDAEHERLAGHLLITARSLAEREGIAESGYRLIVNTGDDGGQVVRHLHLHLIGGQAMRHPMG